MISGDLVPSGLPEQPEGSFPQHRPIKDYRSGRAGTSVANKERYEVLFPGMTVTGGRSQFPVDETLLPLFCSNICTGAGVEKPLLKGFISEIRVSRVRREKRSHVMERKS